MSRATLKAAIVDALTPLAMAREYAMSYPLTLPPKERDLCATCGGAKDWRAWVSLSARCGSDWHEGTTA